MGKHIDREVHLLVAIFLLVSSVTATSSTFYEHDFEGGIVQMDVPNPVWHLRNNTDGPPIGPGRLFEVVKGNAHTGQYSLRFNYDGLNGICNMCGGNTRVQKTGYDGVNIFVDSQDMDLTQDPALAEAGKYIFNKRDGFSKWRILSVGNEGSINNKLTLEKVLDGVEGATGSFKGGDRTSISRTCGVDGSVGGNIDRKSDCNIAIAYFGNVSQKPGESIFRRIYFKIAEGTQLPTNQKLRYWRPDESGTGTIYVTLYSEVGYPLPRLSLLGTAPGTPKNSYKPAGTDVSNGIWYYLEEELKAESSLGANDGEYRLWFSESGKETNEPVVEWAGVGLKPVKNASLWGNHQHDKDAHGYVYIDDVKIANVRIGPEGGVSPPMPPAIEKTVN